MTECPKCGVATSENQTFCLNCGEFVGKRPATSSSASAQTRYEHYNTPSEYSYPRRTNYRAPSKGVGADTNTNRIVAGLLALFGGGIGLQYLYMQKGAQFLLSLLLAATFIPLAIGVLQGIRILCLSNVQFREIYLGIIPPSHPIETAPNDSDTIYL